MRLIDQNGTTDIQYENATLSIDDGNIIAYAGSQSILMAVYSDTETAKTAMRKLHTTYQKLKHHPIYIAVEDESEYFRFPAEEHLG